MKVIKNKFGLSKIDVKDNKIIVFNSHLKNDADAYSIAKTLTAKQVKLTKVENFSYHFEII